MQIAHVKFASSVSCTEEDKLEKSQESSSFAGLRQVIVGLLTH